MAEGVDLPVLATILISLSSGGVAAILGSRRKGVTAEAEGEGQKVVAASFVDSTLMREFIATMKNLDATFRVGTELFGRYLQEHEIEDRVKERLAMAVAAEMAKLGIPPKPPSS